MSQETESTSTTDLIERTLTSVGAAYEDLKQLTADQDALKAMVQTAKGTALLHGLRNEINRLNSLLPFKS